MSANDRPVPNDIDIKHCKIELGALSTTVYNRISRMEPADITKLATRLTAYVLRNELDGGPINNKVMFHVYMTLNDLVGGILVPESLMNWGD